MPRLSRTRAVRPPQWTAQTSPSQWSNPSTAGEFRRSSHLFPPMSRLRGMTNESMARAMLGAMFAASAAAAACSEARELRRRVTPSLFAGLEGEGRRPADRPRASLFAGL